MIQRIQTVFLFFAFLLVGLLFFIPFASITSESIYNFSLLGISTSKPGIQIQQPDWLIFLSAATLTIIFGIIFLFRKRKLQMKLTIASILMTLGTNVAMYILVNKYQSLLNAEIKYSAVFVFPVIAAILLYLAYRSINKDEKLIKSLDRLR